MASEAEATESSFDGLSRPRDLSLFFPFLLGFTNTTITRDSQDDDEPDGERSDRIVLINPLTQGTVVIEGPSALDSLLQELVFKDGPPPASRASIEAMPTVEIEGSSQECVICLDEWVDGGIAKEMPCKHRFHPSCIAKWLGIHGSCPVCRFKMPVEEQGVGKRRDDEEVTERRRRLEREIWVSFTFNSGRRSRDADQTPLQLHSSNSSGSLSSTSLDDHET